MLKNYMKTAMILLVLTICTFFIIPSRNAAAMDNNGMIKTLSVGSVSGSAITYYVNEDTGSDSDNSGQTDDDAFTSIQRAVTEIENNTGVGTIIIMSDIELTSSVFVNGTITIKSDGNQHTITRSSTFTSYNGAPYNNCMMFIYGEMILGDTENTDNTPLLIFDGGSELGNIAPAELLRIQIGGTLKLYSGVSFQNNNSSGSTGGIYNSGNFYMYGGTIRNNSGVVTGGVDCSHSSAVFCMYGGDITYNNGYIGGVNIWNTFILDGGNIANNTGIITGGVFNGQEGTFTMDSGYIINNHGQNSGGVFNRRSMTMSGGTIDGNISDTGVANGVLNDVTSDFTISGSAKVINNEVYLAGNPMIIDGLLTSEGIALTLVPARLTSYPIYEASYNLGDSIVTQKGEIVINSDNLNKIAFSDNAYSLNKYGEICKVLQSSWVSFADSDMQYYYSDSNFPKFIVCDDGKILDSTDYYVYYYDFINAGMARAVITGQGNYAGSVTMTYIINKAIVNKITTPSPENTTFYAFQDMTIDKMKEFLISQVHQVDVEFDGKRGNLYIDWSLTDGTYNPKGGVYTFTGSLVDSENLDGGNLTLTTQITVLPTILQNPVFTDTHVMESTNSTANKNNLGESILPTSGSIPYGDISINYTIMWDDQVIDTTDPDASVIFTGTVTYINPPSWLTLPTDFIVTRKVSINEKMYVYIGLSGDGIKDKYYDGNKVTCSLTTTSMIPYTGEIELLYTSTDGKGYSSSIGPTLPGQYKLTLSIPSNNELFKGSIETFFEIFKKEVVLVADDITVQSRDDIIKYTYHFKEGYEPLGNDELIIEPILYVDFFVFNNESTYAIHISGGSINDNYHITYVDGLLHILKPTTYKIAAIAGLHGRITPSGDVYVKELGNITFNITPDNGYTISHVYINGKDLKNNSSTYKFQYVISNCTIKVEFQKLDQTDSDGDGGVGGGGVGGGGVGGGGVGGGGFGGGGFGGGGFGGAETDTDTTQSSSDNKGSNVENINLSGFDDGVQLTISDNEDQGTLKISYELPIEEILTKVDQKGSDNQQLNISIPLSTKNLLTQLDVNDAKVIDISVTMPDSIRNNKNIEVDNIIDSDLLDKVKKSGKDITIKVVDENGMDRYSWTFLGNDLSNRNNPITDVNLSLKVESLTENKELKELLDTKTSDIEAQGLIINFRHEGTLPSQAKVRLYVGDKEGIRPGSKVFLYHYNNTSGKLDVLPYSTEYYVDENGYISVDILHCSDYIMLTQAAGSNVITKLEDQIRIITSKKTLYIGGDAGFNTKIKIKLPITLEIVKSLNNKSSNSAIGTTTVSYKSNNKKVALVSSDGTITAKGKGTATIIVTFKLYNGITKEIEVKITVKNASVKIVKSISNMQSGDTFNFKAIAYGYDAKNITWYSSDTNILKIDSKTGKALAISAGIVYVEAKIGNVVNRVKIIIK